MKLSVNWLKQFVPSLDNDETKDIAAKMSISLTEVEDVYNVSDKLENIVSAEIIEIVDHPNVPTLKVVVVKVAPENEYQVICGANNIKVGHIVPLCLPGGTVYDIKGKDENSVAKIEEKQIEGTKSEGMLCSAKELGISDDHSGIFILPDDTGIGKDIVKILKDTVIEIENKALTHRPDCFNHEGIAREIAVQNSFKFEESLRAPKPILTADLPITADLVEKKLCKRYSLVVISDVRVKDSPLWMQARLLRSGVRPINNIVDITNYIMLELGQPLHAFDYDKIKGSKLVLRKSTANEKIKTLDGEDRKLPEGILVNADSEKAVGIAGIMGGASSEITNTTNRIILQSENFDMFAIRRASRLLGLRSEASTRFEKGLDPNLVERAINKAAEMIIDLAGGEIASDVIDIYPEPETPKIIEIKLDRIRELTRLDLTNDEILLILEKLGIKLDPEIKREELNSLNQVKLEIPSFRRDLNLPEDLVEEVARIHGYDKITFELPNRTLQSPRRNKKFETERKIASYMSYTGSNQIFIYSFVGEELYKKAELSLSDNLKIANPLSPELEYLQDTLLPSIIEKAHFNKSRFSEQDLFAIAKVVLKKIDENTNIHLQPKLWSGLITREEESDEIFYNLKSRINSIIRELGIDTLKWENLENSDPFKKSSLFHPYKSALIYANDEQIGIIGFIHPNIASNFEISANTVIYELNFDLIASMAKETDYFKPIYNYPYAERSISLLVPVKTEAADVLEVVKDSKIEYLTEYTLSDIYQNEELKNRKSITIDLKFQAIDRTLTDEEVNNLTQNLTDKITRAFSAKQREN